MTKLSLDYENLDSIRHELESGKPVMRSLAGGGRLYIERPQPFLCLYRRPAGHSDFGTEELLTTQASYLISAENESTPEQLRSLLETILAALSSRFEHVLLLEIWTTQAGEPDPETGLLPAKLSLYTSTQDAPLETLEDFDRSLLASDWPLSSPPAIDVVYTDAIGPPEMSAAIPTSSAGKIGVSQIGLALSPFFRDQKSGELLSEIHAELRKIIALSIKRAFYTFSELKTSYSPAHYHELGPRHLEDIDRKVDNELAEIDNAVDLLLNVTPINSEQAWQSFRKSRFSETPEFHYRALRVDPAQLKRQLFAVPLECVEDPTLHYLFANKREELDRQISMLTDRGTADFLLQSQQVYGSPDKQLTTIAKKILETVVLPVKDKRNETFVDASAFKRHAENELDYYRNQDPDFESSVSIRGDIPGLMVSHGQLLIGEAAIVAQRRIEATLQHEIGTHVLTYHNGGRQPLKLLQAGLAGYEELQEGMAILSEFLIGGLSAPRFRQLAGRVEAVNQLVQGASFVDVYNSLHEHYGFASRAAYTVTMRVFRGGGFTKDALYLRGLIEVLNYLEQDKDVENLFVGKIALQHIDITSELLWRRILKPPRLLPRYLTAKQPAAKLAEIRHSNRNAIDLVMESFS